MVNIIKYTYIQQAIDSAWVLPEPLRERIRDFWCDPYYLSFSETLHAYEGLLNDDDDAHEIVNSKEGTAAFLKRFSICYEKEKAPFVKFGEYIRQKKPPMILNYYTYYGWLHMQEEKQTDQKAWLKECRDELIVHYRNATLQTIAALGWSTSMAEVDVVETHSRIQFDGSPVHGIHVSIRTNLPSVLLEFLYVPCQCMMTVGNRGGAIEIHGACTSRHAVQKVFDWIDRCVSEKEHS